MPCDNCACGSAGPADKTAPAVALPKKGDKAAQQVWSLQAPSPHRSRSPSPSPSIRGRERDEQLQEILGDGRPLAHKCGADQREGHQCCKDLKGEDERHLISPEIVRDVIIGLSDGLTVPFALTAGLSSLGSSSLVVTGGLAELCAGAISMGLGGYLASQAEMDHFHYLRRQTQARVLRSCAGEMEREVHSILGPLGVKETLSRLVAEDLREVEESMYAGDEAGETYGTTEGVVRARQNSGSGSGSSGGKKERKWWRFGSGSAEASST